MPDSRPCGIQDRDHAAQVNDALSAPILVQQCECGKHFDVYNTANLNLNIIADPNGDAIAVCSRKCKHLYENGLDPDYDDLYMETSIRWHNRMNKYVLAWNYYVSSCKSSKEKVRITFSNYTRMVPESQTDEMIAVYNLK